MATADFTVISSVYQQVAPRRLWSIARRGVFLITVAAAFQSIPVCAWAAYAIEYPAQTSGDAGVSLPAEPELEPVRECLERDKASCAMAALARLQDSPIAKTPAYLDLKAQALALEHQKAEAFTAIQSAIQANPSQPRYLITQGRIYLRFGDAIDAIECFLKAAKLEPQSPEPLYFLGTSFFLLGERNHSPDYYDRAEHHFQLALQVSRDYHRAEFMLGVIDAIQSHFDQAQTHLQQALRLQPSNPYYHLHYGILLKHEGENSGALNELKTAQKLNPSYALTHFELGTVYQQLADYGNAKNQLESAVALNPNLSVAYYHLGAVYSRMGLTNESKAAYKKFRLTKTRQEEENLDPAASAVVSDESQAPQANSGP